jgi:diguanylate cyclase (GGDEF)-like protein
MRGLVFGYWAAMALAGLPALAQAAWSGAARLALVLVAAGAVATGITLHGPAQRWPWVTVAIALGAWTLAERVPPTAGGLIRLAGFVALAAGLLRLRRPPGEGHGEVILLDTLTAILLLVLSSALLRPPDLPWWWSAPASAPIGDALLLLAAVRLTIVGRANPSARSLVVGTAAALVADTLAALAATNVVEPFAGGQAVAAVVAVASLGWATLHPSMACLNVPRPRTVAPSLRGFWVTAASALVAPLVMLGQALTGGVRDGVVLAATGAALTLVALARVAAAGHTHSRTVVYQSSLDTLTGLASRSHLMWRLTERGQPPWSAVLLVDIDDFRRVNEDAGPSFGDIVLVTLAERLRRLAGPDDVVARFGGDEFAILVAGPRDLTALTREVVAATTEPVPVGERTVRLSACVGVAVPPEPPASGDPNDGGEEMVRRAGLALRAAKEAGPGEWCRYDSDRHALLIERLRLREALVRAIDEGAFRLAYQPIVELRTGQTVGFEALVRWEHPSRGLVSPAEFIAVAEETGLIEAIGGLVLRTAVAEAAGWPRSDVYISVNVSPRQLHRSGFAQRVDEALAAAGLPAERLMLELTESALDRGADDAWGELAELRDRGVRLAIDDFGTGFSSLSYLEQTPIGAIKMDKSFVDSLVLSERQRTVVEGIVSMAQKLDLQVVAEGVESPAARDLLVQMGCPYGQGYLYSTPLTSAEVIGWLSHPAPAGPAPVAAPPAAPTPPPGSPSPATPPPADPAAPTPAEPAPAPAAAEPTPAEPTPAEPTPAAPPQAAPAVPPQAAPPPAEGARRTPEAPSSAGKHGPTDAALTEGADA